jgi:hypothetical protein
MMPRRVARVVARVKRQRPPRNLSVAVHGVAVVKSLRKTRRVVRVVARVKSRNLNPKKLSAVVRVVVHEKKLNQNPKKLHHVRGVVLARNLRRRRTALLLERPVLVAVLLVVKKQNLNLRTRRRVGVLNGCGGRLRRSRNLRKIRAPRVDFRGLGGGVLRVPRDSLSLGFLEPIGGLVGYKIQA